MSVTALRRLGCVVAAAVLTVGGAGLAGCGGAATPPTPVDDPAVRAASVSLPSWYPTQLPTPKGGVIIEVIDTPDTGDVAVGRSVTWRVDRPYEQVVTGVDADIAAAGWTPTDRRAANDGPDAKRTSIYIENGIVEVVRVFTDASLKGTRVTVELPA